VLYSDRWDGRFTYVNIDAPASYYTKDIYFKEGQPEKVKEVLELREGHEREFFYGDPERVIAFIALSVIIAAILGLFFFNKNWKTYGLVVGLSPINVIGILPLLIVSLLLGKVTKKDVKRIAVFELVFVAFFFITAFLFFKPLFYLI